MVGRGGGLYAAEFHPVNVQGQIRWSLFAAELCLVGVGVTRMVTLSVRGDAPRERHVGPSALDRRPPAGERAISPCEATMLRLPGVGVKRHDDVIAAPASSTSHPGWCPQSDALTIPTALPTVLSWLPSPHAPVEPGGHARNPRFTGVPSGGRIVAWIAGFRVGPTQGGPSISRSTRSGSTKPSRRSVIHCPDYRRPRSFGERTAFNPPRAI
jgi:hypothetical protein